MKDYMESNDNGRMKNSKTFSKGNIKFKDINVQSIKDYRKIKDLKYSLSNKGQSMQEFRKNDNQERLNAIGFGIKTDFTKQLGSNMLRKSRQQWSKTSHNSLQQTNNPALTTFQANSDYLDSA